MANETYKPSIDTPVTLDDGRVFMYQAGVEIPKEIAEAHQVKEFEAKAKKEATENKAAKAPENKAAK